MAATKKTAPKPPKKTAKPKAAEPPPAPATGALPFSPLPSALVKPNAGFNILDKGADYSKTVQACLRTAVGQKKNRPTNFKTLAEIRKAMMPLRHFPLQWLVGNYGIPQSAWIDILGPVHIGKTSFIHDLFGGAMEGLGAPCYLQETENKPLEPGRALRFLHSDPATALKMSESIYVDQAFSLRQSIEKLTDWVDVMRGRVTAASEASKGPRRSAAVPMHIPLIAVIDTWSKLMSPKEEVGRLDYDDNMKAENVTKNYKEIGEGSNMGHAKWAAEFARTCPAWLAANNVILITVRHQFTKVDMNAKPGANYNPEASDLFNDTSTGGKAINQNCSIQLIFGRKGIAKNGSGDQIGDVVVCRCHKNSYGPRSRRIEWIIQNEHFRDTETYLQPGFSFDDYFAASMATNKWLGVTADSKRYTCDLLGVTAVTAQELMRTLLVNQEMLLHLGKSLEINGYFDFVDKIRKDLADAEAAAAAAAKPPALPLPSQEEDAPSTEQSN